MGNTSSGEKKTKTKKSDLVAKTQQEKNSREVKLALPGTLPGLLFYGQPVPGVETPGVYPSLNNSPAYHYPGGSAVLAGASVTPSAPPASFFFQQPEALPADQLFCVMPTVRHRGRQVPYCLILEFKEIAEEEIEKAFQEVFGRSTCVNECGIFFDPVGPFCCLWRTKSSFQLMFYFNEKFTEVEVGQLFIHFLLPLKLKMRPVEKGTTKLGDMKLHKEYPLRDQPFSVPKRLLKACLESFKARIDRHRADRRIEQKDGFIRLPKNTPTVTLERAETVYLDTGVAGFTSTSTPGFS